ncbi:MAG TPA: hypothetical protein VE776_01595, partial [Actinomycetota bacterium]|nr:hypothetical protein [Actinomycetota bacterium]
MLLAYSTGLWLLLLGRLQGLEGHGAAPQLPWLVLWLRDSTGLLPGVVVAVWLGLVLAGRLEGAQPAPRPGVARAGLAAAMVTLTSSAALAVALPVQGWLAGDAASALAPAAQTAGDLMVVSPAVLVVSMAVLLVRVRQGRGSVRVLVGAAVGRLPGRWALSVVLGGAMALTVLPGTLVTGAASLAQAAPITCGSLPGTR